MLVQTLIILPLPIAPNSGVYNNVVYDLSNCALSFVNTGYTEAKPIMTVKYRKPLLAPKHLN